MLHLKNLVNKKEHLNLISPEIVLKILKYALENQSWKHRKIMQVRGDVTTFMIMRINLNMFQEENNFNMNDFNLDFLSNSDSKVPDEIFAYAIADFIKYIISNLDLTASSDLKKWRKNVRNKIKKASLFDLNSKSTLELVSVFTAIPNDGCVRELFQCIFDLAGKIASTPDTEMDADDVANAMGVCLYNIFVNNDNKSTSDVRSVDICSALFKHMMISNKLTQNENAGGRLLVERRSSSDLELPRINAYCPQLSNVKITQAPVSQLGVNKLHIFSLIANKSISNTNLLQSYITEENVNSIQGALSRSLLHLAVLAQNRGAFHLLYSQGAGLDAVDKRNKKPYQITQTAVSSPLPFI